MAESDHRRCSLLPYPVVQVAGVHDPAEARLLEDLGVDWLGIPLRLAYHAEDVSEGQAARIVGRVRLSCVLITYLDDACEIASLCRRLGVSIIQLHGDIQVNQLSRLRDRSPWLTVVKSLIIGETGRGSAGVLEASRRLAPWVDAFITDTYDAETGACGATGKTHDWAVSRQLVETAGRPVILAGGLTPANVAAAIHAVGPAGVDVHTGVEGADGRKNAGLVRQFVNRARAAFAATACSRPDDSGL